MASAEKQFRVSALTSTTGVTLVPKDGERKDPVLTGVSIELTYTVVPAFFTLNKIVSIDIQAK